MAGNLELGQATAASRRPGTLMDIRSSAGAGNGNLRIAASFRGRMQYPNVQRIALTTTGSRSRGHALDTYFDPKIYVP